MPCVEITFPWEINGACVAELEVRVTYDFTPGSDDYFCKSFGNWLPGDDPEVEIEDVELIGSPKGMTVPCPDFLLRQVEDYALEHYMPQMIENGMEYLYERQHGDER
jgi:hypothetical protein